MTDIAHVGSAFIGLKCRAANIRLSLCRLFPSNIKRAVSYRLLRPLRQTKCANGNLSCRLLSIIIIILVLFPNAFHRSVHYEAENIRLRVLKLVNTVIEDASGAIVLVDHNDHTVGMLGD